MQNLAFCPLYDSSSEKPPIGKREVPVQYWRTLPSSTWLYVPIAYQNLYTVTLLSFMKNPLYSVFARHSAMSIWLCPHIAVSSSSTVRNWIHSSGTTS